MEGALATEGSDTAKGPQALDAERKVGSLMGLRRTPIEIMLNEPKIGPSSDWKQARIQELEDALRGSERERIEGTRSLLAERDRLAAENGRLRAALTTAADDLYKAANQFGGMRESQRVGFTVPVERNPEKFTEKAARAAAAAAEVSS